MKKLFILLIVVFATFTVKAQLNPVTWTFTVKVAKTTISKTNNFFIMVCLITLYICKNPAFRLIMGVKMI